jgi:histidinol-phosphate/aromatic aminotransferase/cobyric acid decarboxylase-like protein
MRAFDGAPLSECAVDAGVRVHGGLLDAELDALGLAAEDLLDFSSSTNPYGPAPVMIRAIHEAAIARYPDVTGRRAREVLGRSLDVSPDELVLGNGAADLLWSLARAWLGPTRRALIVEPTFSEFGAAARSVGATLEEWRARPEQGFDVDLTAVGELARSSAASVIYLCSPNTPTGSAPSARDLEAFAEAHPDQHIVLDQSFLSSSERHADASRRLPANVACVRSLTKDHGIPGVRVGYLLARPELCRSIEAGRPAWTTSAFAQAAVIASVSARDFVRESRERLLCDRRALASDLETLGIATYPSCTTFLLARLPGVAELRARLIARHRIVVRDCASFGLPDFMRLAAKPPAARQRLIDALCRELGRAPIRPVEIGP